MEIKSISLQADGYIHCKSRYYSSHCTISSELQYQFFQGVNKLNGEIDSGNWPASYLLSMYQYRPKDFVLFDSSQITINNTLVSLKELSRYCCYMDTLYPLFSSSTSVKKLVIKGLKCSKSNYSYSDIKDLFCLDDQRFERPLTGVGNEIFRAMAAIGVSYGKEVFCFPWLSAKRFEGYHMNLSWLLELLANLKKIAIVPIGAPDLNV